MLAREFQKFLIEKRAARFERIGHGHAIGLDQKISRQIGRHVDRKQLSDQIIAANRIEIASKMSDGIRFEVIRQELAD